MEVELSPKPIYAEPGWLVYDNLYEEYGLILRHINGYVYECFWFNISLKDNTNLSKTYRNQEGMFSDGKITYPLQYRTIMLKSTWDKE